MTAPGRPSADVVISAAELQGELASGRDVVLLDIRRDDTPEARAAYRDGHLPGAHFVTLTGQLAGPRTSRSGTNPLPADDAIQADARRWGISPGSLAVVYSAESPAVATRGWWVLRWAGVPDVRYLDGGAAAWAAAGGVLTAEEPAEGSGTFTVSTGSLPVLDADEAAALARTGLLLDARNPGGYTGADPGTGHIPGALSAPGTDNIGPDGLLRAPEELRAHYSALGVDQAAPPGVYCGGGVAATLDILALSRLGVPAALYPGSWSAWSSDPARPVATGDQPG
jgi:thiosulfate/3-mercaptopyruvate sulfurtransferase